MDALLDLLRREMVDQALADRLLSFIKGTEDSSLEAAISQLAKRPDSFAFGLLIRCGYLQHHQDLSVLQSKRFYAYPTSLEQEALGLSPTENSDPVVQADMTIDDDDTQEIDDALSATQDGDQLRIDVDIANIAEFVPRQSPINNEALNRAATLYLPTETHYMLPKCIACDRASLRAQERRPALRTTFWVNAQGIISRWEHRLVNVEVRRRINYQQADDQLADKTGAGDSPLHLLHRAARLLRDERRRRGALLITRQEWKISLARGDGETTSGTLSARCVDMDTPSRQLVAEMMVTTNGLAARKAVESHLPFIFRVQKAPEERLPALREGDPKSYLLLRGKIRPANLATVAAPHWALKLDCYSQITSPIRRYIDLVLQRQLIASLRGIALPYDLADLQSLVGALETKELENRRIEAAVQQRWALEYLLPYRKAKLPASILNATGGGYRVEILRGGAFGFMPSPRHHAVGAPLEVRIEQLNPLKGALRLREVRN